MRPSLRRARPGRRAAARRRAADRRYRLHPALCPPPRFHPAATGPIPRGWARAVASTRVAKPECKIRHVYVAPPAAQHRAQPDYQKLRKIMPPSVARARILDPGKTLPKPAHPSHREPLPSSPEESKSPLHARKFRLRFPCLQRNQTLIKRALCLDIHADTNNTLFRGG